MKLGNWEIRIDWEELAELLTAIALISVLTAVVFGLGYGLTLLFPEQAGDATPENIVALGGLCVVLLALFGRLVGRFVEIREVSGE